MTLKHGAICKHMYSMEVMEGKKPRVFNFNHPPGQRFARFIHKLRGYRPKIKILFIKDCSINKTLLDRR